MDFAGNLPCFGASRSSISIIKLRNKEDPRQAEGITLQVTRNGQIATLVKKARVTKREEYEIVTFITMNKTNFYARFLSSCAS